ncbi:MAG: hypothetical protein AAFW73_11340 [Bacteroidota bacterium]
MKKLFCVMLSGLLLLCGGALHAQVQATSELTKASPEAPTLLPIKKVVLLYELPMMDETALPDDPENPEVVLDEALVAQPIYDINLLLQLFSTAELAKIHVSIGTAPGTDDFANHSFVFDQQLDLPAPFSYQRDGKTIVLGVGQTTGLTELYAAIQLEDRNGRRSEVRYQQAH